MITGRCWNFHVNILPVIVPAERCTIFVLEIAIGKNLFDYWHRSAKNADRTAQR